MGLSIWICKGPGSQSWRLACFGGTRFGEVLGPRLLMNRQPWITPSLFDNTGDTRIVDEYTFGQYQDQAKARAALQKHWDTFITEYDFAQIAAAGCVFVYRPSCW